MKTYPSLKEDLSHMRAALSLARRGLGTVAPNPAVGCVLVKDGDVVGRGWTQPGGRPHAETEALGRAGDKAKGATAYVTLEPCDHHGQTPPCSQALIDAGISRCVVACQDPDERVSGRGIERLKAAGVEVTFGVLEEEAVDLNAGFFLKNNERRPFYTLKCATTIDGRIATKTGESRWITCERSRNHGHMLRANHDAILIGIGTAIADNPFLDCRLPGLEDQSPVRIVLDTKARLSAESKLAKTADQIPTWLVTSKQADRQNVGKLMDQNVKIIECDTGPNGMLDLIHLSELLAETGLTRVLIEGGGAVNSAFLKENLVDQVYWYTAPIAIGGDGIPALSSFGVEKLENAVGFERVSAITSGQDSLTIYRRVHLV